MTTTEKTTLKREFRRLRGAGWRAADAYRSARTVARFKRLDYLDYVRLSVVADEFSTVDDLAGDCFNPKANPDIRPERLERERAEFVDRVERMGVVGIIGQFRTSDDAEWQDADSCFGFVGNDWQDSGYDADIMNATIDALRDALRDRPRVIVRAGR